MHSTKRTTRRYQGKQNAGGARSPLLKWTEYYSIDIAVTGQLSTACWQSQVSQLLGLTTHALSSLSSKTLGQSSEQSPQPIQVSMSTFGVAITNTPFFHVVRNKIRELKLPAANEGSYRHLQGISFLRLEHNRIRALTPQQAAELTLLQNSSLLVILYA